MHQVILQAHKFNNSSKASSYEYDKSTTVVKIYNVDSIYLLDESYGTDANRGEDIKSIFGWKDILDMMKII